MHRASGQVAARCPSAAPAAPPRAAGRPASVGDRYVVRRGETLSGIARRIDVSMVRARGGQPDRQRPTSVVRRPEAAHPRPGGRSRAGRRRRRCAARGRHGRAAAAHGQGFLWPVNGKVIGGFGPTGHGQRRDGIDIAAPRGRAGAGRRGRHRRLCRRRHPRLRPPDPGAARRGLHHHLCPQRRAAGRGRRRGRARPGDRPGRLDRRRGAQPCCISSCARAAQPIDPETVLVREPTAVASTTQ